MHYLVSAAVGFVLGSAVVALAQIPDPTPPRPPGAQYDIPEGSRPQTVIIGHGEIPAGQVNPVREHPGVEMGYIAQGDMELWFKDKPSHTYHTGDAFLIPRETPYQVRVSSKVPVILYNAMVFDKDKPRTLIIPGLTLIR